MTITAFCVLAEPDKLMYPYIESLRSISRFADKIVINYAASEDIQFRQFESNSYERIISLKDEVKDRCKIEIILDKHWKLQKNQSYDEIRNIVQRALDDCKEGWFMKFDADNVFYSHSAEKIKSLFNDETDYLVFGRINMIDRHTFIANNNSNDIYAVNVSSLKKKNIDFEVGDITQWCVVNVKQRHNRQSISDPELVSINYDATFFTKERVVDFWRKTEDAYSTAQNRANRLLNVSDDAVVSSFINYKKAKLGSLKKGNRPNFTHPQDISEKIESLSEIHWGFNNFKMM